MLPVVNSAVLEPARRARSGAGTKDSGMDCAAMSQSTVVMVMDGRAASLRCRREIAKGVESLD